MLLETVLGPLWVWWGIDEAPSAMMLIGGGIVLTCLSVFLILRAAKPPEPPPVKTAVIAKAQLNDRQRECRVLASVRGDLL